jgi:hypothetical protein
MFEGRADTVISVRALVRVEPKVFWELNDNGIKGDEKAGDNVWTGWINVPPRSRSGEYHLDIEALDKNWNPIYLTGTVKEGKGDPASVVITVK